MLDIRNERKEDYSIVEEITRKAFYNVYVPGCMEHYLVHVMRDHEDFIPELDFVLERDGQVIGNIMYTKAKLTDENGTEKEILTFGPVSVLPEYQRNGYGKLRCDRDTWEPGELCKLWFSVLQKIQCVCGRREISGGHAGEGIKGRRAGRKKMVLLREPGYEH